MVIFRALEFYSDWLSTSGSTGAPAQFLHVLPRLHEGPSCACCCGRLGYHWFGWGVVNESLSHPWESSDTDLSEWKQPKPRAVALPWWVGLLLWICCVKWVFYWTLLMLLLQKIWLLLPWVLDRELLALPLCQKKPPASVYHRHWHCCYSYGWLRLLQVWSCQYVHVGPHISCCCCSVDPADAVLVVG